MRFACEIESVPEAEITWEKDGAPVAFVSSNHSVGDGDDDDEVKTDDNSRELFINGSTTSFLHDKTLIHRFVTLNSGRILHIYNVQSADAGIYRYIFKCFFFLISLIENQ